MTPNRKPRAMWMALAMIVVLAITARADDDRYSPADEGQHPQGSGTRLLPDHFLRGYDPITAYFSSDTGPGRGPADEGAKRLKIQPDWPGAWFWADRKTLEFRPAEPWPALARFSVDAGKAHRILTTMMSAPSSMSPSPDSDDLAPFRAITLTFPQTLSIDSLRQMIHLEVRDLPGLADSPRRTLKDFSITQLPRGSHRDAAVYAITLKDDIPEGKQLRVDVKLALGDEGRTLWTGRVSTRKPFHLESVQCGASQFSVAGGGSTPKDLALACGNHGEFPQLVFSAPVKDLTLTELSKLVRLDPAVDDLSMQVYGSRVELRGKFVPDTLYRMQLSAAPIKDESDRDLQDPGSLEVYFYRGWKTPFLRWNNSTATIEANGPRMLPLDGYGDARADVRVYRIDPQFPGLWPFPNRPVVVKEENAPPFPGEEPAENKDAVRNDGSADELVAHIRLLGSPLVSKVVDLPLTQKSGTTRFGLDLAPLLDPVVGAHRPGTYLVGLRRLTGAPTRSYMRVQITNLSLTAVEEREQVVFFVRTLDDVAPVKNARIVLDGTKNGKDDRGRPIIVPATTTLETDGGGKAIAQHLKDWTSIKRVSVQSGEDVLLIDPSEAPPKFTSNHWSSSSSWLDWLMQTPPPPVNDKTLAFLFTERPIYRPGETVFLKGWVRRKADGKLQSPGDESAYGLKIQGPGGQTWSLPLTFTPLAGFSAEFKEKDIPTGDYSAVVFTKKPYEELSQRPFKIDAYRIPTFEVQLGGALKVPLDAPFKVKAAARYYAGGSVANQPIAWTVTKQPYHYIPEGRKGYLFASSTQFGRQGVSHGPDVITKKATLDKNGGNEISVNPALDIDGSARTYRFEATVTGPDEQQVTATTTVKALPPFILGMKLQRYAEKATEIKPEVIAVGVDDKLKGGQEVTVRLYKRIWHSNLRETHFATGEAKYVTEQEDVKLAEQTVTTSAKEAVMPRFPIKDSGVYVVEIVGRDKLGRVQSLMADLYIGGKGAIAWEKSREGVFNLNTDKPEYVPGETAHLIIESPFQTGRALVIVEQPEGNVYTWHDVTDGKAVHDVRIADNNVPNLPVHVVLMRGRIGEGTTDDSRYKPQTLASSLDVKVKRVMNEVDVGLDFPETARPGSTVNVKITMQDDHKKPLSGEVTLWLVDEAVLSLMREQTLDPLTSFIRENKATTSIRDTRNLIVGKIMEQDEDAGGDGEEKEGEGRPKRVVRKNFQTVPYYQATLKVENGVLVVPVKLSDDLTNFRVRAEAVSGWTRFGHIEKTIHVRLPLIVQPQLPRFVREGDHFWGGGVARLLEGAEGAGTVDLDITGPVDGATTAAPVDLRNNAAQSVVFPLTVRTTNTGQETSIKFGLGVTRKSDGQGDAFEVKLPVLPDRMIERFAWFDHFKPGTVALKPFPETPRPGTASQQVVVTSVPGVLDLAASLDYMAAYPHGCLEQRVSQVMPEIAQGDLIRSLGLDEGYGPKAMIGAKKVLESLQVHQDEQGLFAYWPGSPGDIQLTAQVLKFMVAARKAGLPVDQHIQTRAEDALKRVLRSDYNAFYEGYRYNQQTEAVLALAQAGMADDAYLSELYEARKSLDTAALANLTIAMAGEGDRFKSDLQQLESDLWDTVVFRLFHGRKVFDSLQRRRQWWWGGYLESDRSALSNVFQGLLLVDPGDARQPLLRDAVIEQASATEGFGNTHENYRGFEALATYLKLARDQQPAVRVQFGDRALDLDSAHRVGKAVVSSDTPLSLTVNGVEVGGRVSYTYLPATPGTNVTSLNEGFIVSRSSTLVHPDGTMDAVEDDKSGATKKIAQGDILELHARIQTEADKYFVAFIVPFAAGLEPMNPELQTSGADAKPSEADTIEPTYVQRLDSEVRYYFNELPRGTHTLHFRVRAATEGEFVHPAPWAEQMYKQDVRGRGEGMRIVITGAHEK